MKPFPLLLLTISIWSLFACGNNNTVSGNESHDIIQVDSLIVTDTGAVTISFGDGVLLQIPQGTSSYPITATIKRVNTVPFPEEIHILLAYNVSLDCGTEFSPSLKFTFPYESSEVTYPDSLKPVYYDEVKRKWVAYTEFTLDTVAHTVTFESDHLTVVGLAEFLTNGGYPLKFTGVPGICIYYTLNGTHAVKTAYDADFEDYHFLPKDSNYAPLYIQDIAFGLKEARAAFAVAPHSLNGPASTETITIYVKNLGGTDGEYGSVSGVLYISNDLKPVTNPVGISQRQNLYSTVAHEYLHLIQDYYYVMNKGSIGLWWLEAIATQADRMVWPSDYTYYESEIFAIDMNSVLIDMISKSWDTNNNSPDWYLAGTFLHYLAFHREGSKLSIANLLKAGGEGILLYRNVLNYQIQTDCASFLDDEYAAFIRYLFEEGNENLTAIPNGDMAYVEASSNFNTSVSLKSDLKKQTLAKAVPYLSSQMITLKSTDTDTVSMLLKKKSLYSEVWLCTLNGNALTGWTPVTETGIEVTLAHKLEKAYVIIINPSYTGGTDSVLVTYQPLKSTIKPFHFLTMNISFGSTDGFIYTDSEANTNSFSMGFYNDTTSYDYRYRSISSAFNADGTFEVIAEKIGIYSTDVDSTRIRMSGNYDENALSNVKFTETRQHIVNQYENYVDLDNDGWNDTTMEGTLYEYENKSLTLGTIPLDTVPAAYITLAYTYYALWNKGSEIAPQIKGFSNDFVSYWKGESITDTLTQYTEAVASSINWANATSMTFTCETKP